MLDALARRHCQCFLVRPKHGAMFLIEKCSPRGLGSNDNVFWVFAIAACTVQSHSCTRKPTEFRNVAKLGLVRVGCFAYSALAGETFCDDRARGALAEQATAHITGCHGENMTVWPHFPFACLLACAICVVRGLLYLAQA